jgi:hypothetical protein
VVLSLPVDVLIGIVEVPVTGTPVIRERVLVWAGTGGVRMREGYRATFVWAAIAMGFGTMVALVSPRTAVVAVVVLVAVLREVALFSAG